MVSRKHKARKNTVAAPSLNDAARNHLEKVMLNRKTQALRRVGSPERRCSMPEKNISATFATLDRTSSKDSQDSVLVDMAPFMKKYSSNSTPNGQPKTINMFMDPSKRRVTEPFKNPYVEPSHPVSLRIMSPTQAGTETSMSSKPSLTASLSCGSPTDSPPPLPKRAYKPKMNPTPNNKITPFQGTPAENKGVSSFPPEDLPPSHIVSETNINSGIQKSSSVGLKRKWSQPVLDPPTSPFLLNVGSIQDLPSPGNLETCSQSSSSSALHPISISALTSHSRASLPTSPSSELLNIHPSGCVGGEKGAWPGTTGKERLRKISAPEGSHWSTTEVGSGLANSRAGSNLTPAVSPSSRIISPIPGMTLGGSGPCSHISEVEEEGAEREKEEKDNEIQKEPLCIETMIAGGNGDGDGSGDGAVSGGKDGALSSVCGNEEARNTASAFKLETCNKGTFTAASNQGRSITNTDNSPGTPTYDSVTKKPSSFASNTSCVGGQLHRGVSAPFPNMLRGVEENETGNHAMLYFPYQMQNSSPAQLGTGSMRDSPVETMTELRPNSPLEAAGLSPDNSTRNIDLHSSSFISMSTSHQPIASREGASSRGSNHTNSSIHSISSSDPRMDSSIRNPIFVETTDDRSYDQVTMHTSHPYEYWATNQQDITNLRALSKFPWFHGMISRNNASQLVLMDQESGMGQYLVRQSESREGNFVLTFNYHNRAKVRG